MRATRFLASDGWQTLSGAVVVAAAWVIAGDRFPGAVTALVIAFVTITVVRYALAAHRAKEARR